MPDGSTIEAGRVPPSDLDAEGAVLSACLLRAQDCLDDVRQVLKPGHFYADANRRIYEAILDLDAEGKPVDIVLVAGRLRAQARLEQVGGSPYLSQLSDATPAVAHVVDHARVVVEKARLRRVISTCQTFAAEGYDDVGNPREWSLSVAQALADVAATGEDQDPPESLADIVPRELQAMGERSRLNIELSGLDTKLVTVNRLTGGLLSAKLHVVAGRPGMGKSSYALQLALNTAEQGLLAFFGSAEMTKEELVRKLLSMVARVNHTRVKSGKMSQEEWARIADAAHYLAGLPLVIFYKPAMTISALRGALRKEQRACTARGVKLGLVAADYMQIMNGEELVSQGANREQHVAAIVQRLTWMAGEFDVPVLALSQLNRAVETRDKGNKRPNLGDLRESGAIEQEAYTVQLIYRDEYYHKDSPDKGLAEIELAKNRGGPTGRAYVKFTGEYGRFDNLAADDQQPAGGDEYDNQSAA